MEWRGSKEMGAEGERELMRGVCVGRKPGCPRPSGRAVHIGVPPLLDSAWELGLLLWRGKPRCWPICCLASSSFSSLALMCEGFGSMMALFWCIMKTDLKSSPFPPNFFFFPSELWNKILVLWPALHITSERQKRTAERLMELNLTKPDCAFLLH